MNVIRKDTMTKFRKKPVVIDAIQFLGGEVSFKNILEWNTSTHRIEFRYEYNCLFIPTDEGIMTANVGDWIIRGVKGEIYPCKPDIFEQTYERIDE